MYFEIEKEITPEERDIYKFNVFDHNAVFVGLSREIKPKGKRKWQRVQWWDKYNARDCNLPQPELTLGIRAEALEIMQSMCKVSTWDEWKAKQ